jgi:anti-anti-sigma factor
VVIAIAGEVDLSVVEEFSVALEPYSPARAVVLDMDKVTFLDSSALHVLLQAKQRVAESGGKVVLVASDDSVVASLFALTGMDDSLPRYATLEEAKTALE